MYKICTIKYFTIKIGLNYGQKYDLNWRTSN